MKRRICLIITSHIHYTRSRKIIRELRSRPDVDLRIVIGASAILPQYGDVLSSMEKDGVSYDERIIMTLAGGGTVAMAKTTGIGLSEFATVFDNLKPDIVLLRGDRYEILAAAIAAAYMNITVAHLEGGDVSGSIDESVRHAVTKLSHIHFVTNEEAHRRVLRMGENSAYVFDIGCPELEDLETNAASVTSADINALGVGEPLDIDAKPFVVVMHHPVTTEEAKNREHAEMLLHAVRDLNRQVLWFWPNVDAGTDDITKAIRVFRERDDAAHMRFLKYLEPDQFTGLLQKTSCLIGNSSAGIKEAGFLGVPVVNIGSRQNGRMRGSNVIDAEYDPAQIHRAITQQIEHGRYERSTMYHKERCAQTMADILATVPLYSQKRFMDNSHA